MFDKYGNEQAYEVSKDDELDARVEFSRQRQFLEKSIVGLKKRVNTCAKKNESYYKVMEENMVLIKDINELRQKLEMNRKKYNNLQSIFKAKVYKSRTPKKQAKSNFVFKSEANVETVKKQNREHVNISQNKMAF